MIKIILPFYIICFVLYIFFTRQPDYEDGEFTTGTIHYISNKPNAVFIIDKNTYTINAAYPLRHLKEDDNVKIIYDTSNPSSAAVYTPWGYWLQWQEMLASILLPLILYFAAKAITGSPTPEALMEELEMKKKTQRKKWN